MNIIFSELTFTHLLYLVFGHNHELCFLCLVFECPDLLLNVRNVAKCGLVFAAFIELIDTHTYNQGYKREEDGSREKRTTRSIMSVTFILFI